MSNSHPDGGWYCPTCNTQTLKLIAAEKPDLCCPSCYSNPINDNQGLLHTYSNPNNRRLSEAKERVIMRRYKAPDGQILDRSTRKPTER